jgi:hypothetical protein
MVRSGLKDELLTPDKKEIRVSPYRLATHVSSNERNSLNNPSYQKMILACFRFYYSLRSAVDRIWTSQSAITCFNDS